MEEKDLLFSEEIYLEQLSTINEINFTPREIDVIACLLNARRTSQIASILSISPRTVTTHFRNIMLKLDCNSQEGIISFVEQSHKLHILREYYSSLLIKLAFEKLLKEISKLKREDNSTCLLVF
ncbi:MAG: helix-turn-helix transcriptional regulator [Alphaproteobacteria bacterium]|nr:helix-turn-helix transcriptional regulator [Alphaproteobacteria bacterium]